MEKTCPMCGHAVSVIAGLTVDKDRGEIRFAGKSLALPKSEFRLFTALAEKPGRCLSKEVLSNAIYFDHHGGETPADKIIDVYVCKMRKKLAPMGLAIKTHWARGYELIAPGVVSLATEAPVTSADVAAMGYGGQEA